MRFARSLLSILTLLLLGCSKHSLPEGSIAPETVRLKLSRGDFPVLVYAPKVEAKGIVVFGSGDGGWKIWEERACRSLALAGWRVIGWDSREYASDHFSHYDARILGRDLQSMATAGGSGLPRSGLLIYGGYSTGAEQAVAGAAWMLSQGGFPDARPSGLLLVSPGERGRYGLNDSDLIGITPQGRGSFALDSLAPDLGNLAVAQIHGTFDPLDSTKWIAGLSSLGPHRIFMINGAGHFFGDADARLQETLRQAADWLFSMHAAIHSKTS